MAKEKGNLILAITMVVGFTVIIAMGLYLIYDKSIFIKEQKQEQKQEKPLACTMEVKVCPDGSAVGRTGPNCEFAECPVVVDPIADWQTYTNNEYGFEVKYPLDWIFYAKNDKFLIVNFCGPSYATENDCSVAGLNHTPVVMLRNDIKGGKDGGYCVNNPTSIYCKEEARLSQENIKIDNRDAEMFEIQYGVNNDKNDLMVFWKNNFSDERMYGLEVSKNYPEYSDVFNKMIFTFKFTK